MKKLNTTNKVAKSGKVEITLTKPYLVEGKIIPKGTKVLVESSDIYDDYETPETEIMTMRRLRRMDHDDYSTPSNIADASVPNESDDIYTMRRLARMKHMDAVAEEDLSEEDEEFLEDEELMALRRLARMRRMKSMRRMAKDKKEEEEDKEEDKE